MTRQNSVASRVSSTTKQPKQTYPPAGYIEEFLSVFDRPPQAKPQLFEAAKLEKTVSTENLLRKRPSVKSVEVDAGGTDAIILWKSNNQPVDSWTVSPSVLLALLSATANVCLQYAHSQGIVIAWWRKALHGGKLVDLHNYWESGDGVWAAATSRRAFNRISLATLVASAVVFDGPLLQRASNIVSRSETTSVNVTAPIADEMPYGYTGYGMMVSGYGTQLAPGKDLALMNQTFAKIVNEYTKRTPIITQFSGCVGNCSGTVKAAGLAVNCSVDAAPWNSNMTKPNSVDFSETVFNSSFNWIPSALMNVGTYQNGTNPFPNEAFIDFNLQYVTGRSSSLSGDGNNVVGDFNQGPVAGNCTGTKVFKRCSMRSATLLYPFVLVNNTATLSGDSSNFVVDHVQAVGTDNSFFDNHDLNPMGYTTLGGVTKAAENMFSSVALQDEYSVGISGSLASQYLDYGPENRSYFATEDGCAINWYDPTTDIVNALNEIMFRTALVASNVSKFAIINASVPFYWTNFWEAWPVNITGSGIPEPQILSMQQAALVSVFESHLSYLAAALALMVFGVIVVLPTFHGFWELGRNVSLNPLEVAKAFNAEILQGGGSNASVSRLMERCRGKEVRYGEVVANDMRNMQGLGISEQPEPRGHRLEIIDLSRVAEPRAQEMYM